jgi:hypothetical protein
MSECVVERRVLDELLVIAVGLAVQFVEHAGDYTGELIR